MIRTQEEKLLKPTPGTRIAAAKRYGIDLTLLAANLKLTPAERLRRNEQAVNDLRAIENAMKIAKKKGKFRIK